MEQDAVDAARRAYIAKTAPHLLTRTASPSPGPVAHLQEHGGTSSSSSSEEGPSRNDVGTASPRTPHYAQEVLKHIARVPALQHAPGSSTLYTTPNAPANRAIWRYVPAGPDPAHLPRVLFREVPMAPLGVHWDWIDRSSYTKVSLDANVISTDRGWRSARANVGVRWGAWYYEVDYLEPERLSQAANVAVALAAGVAGALARGASPSTAGSGAAGVGTVTASPRPHVNPASGSATPQLGSASAHHYHLTNPPAVISPAPIGPLPAPMKDGPHLRLGWGRREASLNAPAGFDGYSYAIRDSTGQKCHLSRMAPYAEQGFVPGDTIGIYIYIPPPPYIAAKMRRPRGQQVSSASNVQGNISNASELPSLPSRERHVRRKRVPIRYKGQLYFESLEYNLSKEMEHLMERSRRGLQKTLPADEGQPDIIGIDCPLSNDPAVAAVWEKTQAEKRAAAAAAQQKKRRLPGQPMANPAANLNLRPLPVLKGSFIGFSINGKWQGVAFRDLLDFRPLATRGRHGNKGSKSKSSNGKGAKDRRGSARSTPIPAHDSAASTDSSDTTSDSSAYSSDSSASSRGAGPGNKGKGKASGGHHSSHHHRRSESPDGQAGRSTTDRILKMRQNLCDDGVTGYFPFVSLFGGARAQLNPGPDFKYPMDVADVEGDVTVRTVLAEVEHGNHTASTSGGADVTGQGKAGDFIGDEVMRDAETHNTQADPSSIQPEPITWRPLSERYEEYYAEQLAYDLADERRLERRLHRRNGRRRRGEFDPYDLLRHSGDGTGVRGASAIDAGGIAGALGEHGALGEGALAGGLAGTGSGGDAFGSLLADGEQARPNASGMAGGSSGTGGTTTARPKSDPNRSKAGRRESGKGQRPMPLTRKKKKKTKEQKRAAAAKALETKRRRKEEEEAAALLAVEGDEGDENEQADGDDDDRASGSEGDEDDDEEEVGSERKKMRMDVDMDGTQ
ncbi:hypothetical protein A4X13_0g1907 [Tilletia indica]|uniref:Uncharacterized protein n=1 Tax=Tilletia indica TaxID=43049 RepID=A0A177TKG6_9BASI|nr:hypothetical protein A4X13_0g1907 [Tilletia indica]